MFASVITTIRDASIRKKLILLIITISTSILLFASLLQLVYGIYYSKNALANELTITANVLGDQSIAALEFFDQESASGTLASLKQNNSLRVACIYDANGEIFATYLHADHKQTETCPAHPDHLDHAGHADQSNHSDHLSGHNISVLQHISRGETHIGMIYLESDLKRVEQFIMQYLVYAVFLIVFIVGIAWFLSARLQYMISAPLFHLVETAQQFSKKQDYSVRAVKESEDELGTLVDAFNEMLSKIQYRDTELNRLNEELEQKVELRTAELRTINTDLTDSLEKLKQTQDYLVQSEKMAALGGLVAGVAHEINTPVGVGMLAASHLKKHVDEYHERYEQGVLTRSDFEAFLNTTLESTQLLLSNLKRAADLIHSFKQVAVDQSSGEQRYFSLRQYLEEVVQSLRPKLKHDHHQVVIDCPDKLYIQSYPGLLSQVISNLVINSSLHAFEKGNPGTIQITASYTDGKVQLRYTDNGKGMTPENLKQIFDPFFTTKRAEGGSGLGMHVVYNIVIKNLGGTIHCDSKPGEGVVFDITFPAEDHPVQHNS